MRRLLLCLLLGSSALAVSGVTIRENDRTYRYACTTTNDTITIRGNNNRVALTGLCENVVIHGNGNVVSAPQILRVWISGNENRVGVAQGRPALSNTGNNNQIDRSR